MRPFIIRKSFIGVLIGRLDLQFLILITIVTIYAIFFITGSLSRNQASTNSLFSLPSLAFLPFLILVLEGMWFAYVILVWQHLYYKVTPASYNTNGEIIDARPATLGFVSGILFRKQEDVPLTGVQNISYTQSILGRILGHGNIMIHTDKNQILHVTNIPRPHFYERILREEDRKFVGEKLISPIAQQRAMVRASQQLGMAPGSPNMPDISDN